MGVRFHLTSVYKAVGVPAGTPSTRDSHRTAYPCIVETVCSL